MRDSYDYESRDVAELRHQPRPSGISRRRLGNLAPLHLAMPIRQTRKMMSATLSTGNVHLTQTRSAAAPCRIYLLSNDALRYGSNQRVTRRTTCPLRRDRNITGISRLAANA
jgi:hypothetical protein